MARPAKYRLSPDEVLTPENARKLAGHVSEIEFFRAEVEKLQTQIAGIYDAADDDGFDKKFIRKAVARRAKEGPALEAEENAVGCYIEAVKKGLPTRTREGNPADVLPAHDAETGEIIDHEPLPPDPAAREAGDDAVAGASSSGRTEPSADGHISAQGAEETTGEPKAKADPDPETRVQIPRAEANPPETATESTSGVESRHAETARIAIGRSRETEPTRQGEALARLQDGVATIPVDTAHFETTPPRPVRRHEFNRCWPDRWGMPLAVFTDEVREHGVQKPIVKIGDEILDGWCRYTVARDLGIEYPVVQYQGDDPLADSIRWNLDAGGRMLTLHEQKQIAVKLSKVSGNEHRASEILELFGFKAEEAAA